MKPIWFKREIITVTTQQERETILHVQRVMRCPETGLLDDATASHLRGFQNLFGLQTTGTLNEATAEQIERIRVYGSTEGM